MAEKDLHHRITGDSTSLERAMRRAARAMTAAEREARKLERQQQRTRDAMDRAGRGMMLAGAAIAAGLGLAVKAAIDWETAWTGVVKTVDGTQDQLAALEDDLRSMAGELPASHAEIAAVAEAAGQLGIAVDDVAEFTRTMIDMGEATNLTAEEAAVAIAQMTGVMGTATSEVDNLGAAIVALGNTSATTERDIVEMSQRIAGAGATIGLSQSDVLGFAAALSSVGIEAAAGGSAISRVMIAIETRVRAGGEELEALARVAGMSAADFRTAYERDAARGIAAFINGLGRMQAQGQNVFTTLEDLEFGEVRVRDALLRLASAGDLLNRSLDTSADAWDENVALTEEAERRYGTAAARLEIARNQLNEFAISVGEMFVPVVADAADKLGDLLGFLSGLPDPVKQAAGGGAALSAALLLVTGAAFSAVNRVANYRQALQELGLTNVSATQSTRRFATGVRFTVGFLGRATAALIAFQLAGAAASAAFGEDFDPQMQALTEGISRFGQEGRVAGEAARIFGEDAEGLARSLRTLGPEGVGPSIGNTIKQINEFIFQLDDMEGSMGRSKETVDAYDQALASLVQSGRQEEAAAAFERLAGLAEENGVSTERLIELLPAYAAALEVAADEGDNTAGGLEQIRSAAEEAAIEIDALKDAFNELFGIQMSVDRATINYHQTMDDLIAELEDGALKLDAQSEAGRANRGAVLDQIDAINDLRDANIDAGMGVDEANEKYLQQIDDLEELLLQMGFNEDEVRDLIREYKNIPARVKTQINLAGTEPAIERVRRLQREINGLTGKTVHIGLSSSGVGGLGGGFFERHGGVTIPAQHGLLRQAGVFSPVRPARFAFAEPQTGGEAFIPRRGNRRRSLAIANMAASWHGGRVVAGDQPVAGVVGGGIRRHVIELRPHGNREFAEQLRSALREVPGLRVEVRGS